MFLGDYKLNYYIWGIGEKTNEYINCGINLNKIEGFIDSYSQEREFKGKPVYRPEYISYKQAAGEEITIFVASSYIYEIKKQCEKLHIDMNRVIFAKTCLEVCCEKYGLLQNQFPELYAYLNQYNKTPKYKMEIDYMTDYVGLKEDSEYEYDYYRYRTFELIANQINKNMIEGSVAELGVFRGRFARIINQSFPDKELYLFDTFDGFDANEAEREKSKGRCGDKFTTAFKDTSEALVLGIMKYPERVKIIKGLFPSSVGVVGEKQYCFVSLDVDFEESTYEGLNYFYPRLKEGGYIMIHDYNSHLKGVAEAVRRYQEDNNIRFRMVPLADHYGSLVIVK